MTAATRGQAEYETWRAAVPEIVCNVPAGPWEDLPETVRAGFAAIAAIAARKHDNLTAATWRQGRSQPRNIYAQTGDDWKAHPLIGHMDTAELAAIACEARNAHGPGTQPQPAQDAIPPWDQASPADREAFTGHGKAALKLTDYIRANQGLAKSLFEATDLLLHGTDAEQALARELRERHGLEP